MFKVKKTKCKARSNSFYRSVGLKRNKSSNYSSEKSRIGFHISGLNSRRVFINKGKLFHLKKKGIFSKSSTFLAVFF